MPKRIRCLPPGELPEDIRIQVENHLGICRDCAESYRLNKLAFNVILEEKEIESNPFLVTRIMAGIEELDLKYKSSLQFRYIRICSDLH